MNAKTDHLTWIPVALVTVLLCAEIVLFGGYRHAGGLDSPTLKVIHLLSQGKVAEAEAAAIAIGGGTAPVWFQRLLEVYSNVAMRDPGKCSAVAKKLEEAFRLLGQKPEIMNIRAVGGPYGVMGFDLGGGKVVRMATNGFHQVVQVGDKVYDAFTGAAGMTWKEYLSKVYLYNSAMKLEID